MKRRNFRAVVTDNTGNTFIGERNTFAWNSALRATEAIVRQHARDNETIYHGAKPAVLEAGVCGNVERIYRREWSTASGHTVRALVWEVV